CEAAAGSVYGRGHEIYTPSMRRVVFTPQGGTNEMAPFYIDGSSCPAGRCRSYPGCPCGQVAGDGLVHCRMEDDEGGWHHTVRADLAPILESMRQGLRSRPSDSVYRRPDRSGASS